MTKFRKTKQIIFIILCFLFSDYSWSQVTAEVEEESAKAWNYANNNRFDSAAISYEKAFYISSETEVVLLSRAGVYYGLSGQHDKAFATLNAAVDAGWSNYNMLSDKKYDSLKIYTKDWSHFVKHVEKRHTVNQKVFYWGWYYGLISLLFLLNLFMFIRLRETAFLFYSLFLLFVAQWIYNNNAGNVYYFSKVMFWMKWVNFSKFIPNNSIVILFCFFFTLFVGKLLDFKSNMPRLARIFNLTAAIFIALLILTLFIKGDAAEPIAIIGLLAITLVILTSFIVGIILLKRKYKPARFFVIAISSLTLLSIGGLLNSIGINIPFPNFGGVFEMIDLALIAFYILLSFALGDRMKILQDELSLTQKKALEVLEEKVQERTEEVRQQKHLVEEKQREIIDSISYAKRLQEAILPPADFITNHIPNNFILYKPKDIVAGDFYWAEKINDMFFIAAADSTGHGVPGAMVSVVCSNALNRAVKEFGLTETGKILDKTRELVLETFEKSASEVKDGMDISLVCIDSKNKNIFWSGANNPLWYIQDNELKEIKADKQPIGKTEYPKPFTTHQIEYKGNTTFYLFTDGFADQFGGPNGKKFKYKQFSDLLLKHTGLLQAEQSSILDKAFAEWKGDLEQVDDVCVIGIKI